MCPPPQRARPGLSGVLGRWARPGELAAGGSASAVVSKPYVCRAPAVTWYAPPPPPPRASACGRRGGGAGPQSWGPEPVGGAPARHSGPGPPGAGSLFWPSPMVPAAARFSAVAPRRTAGGGGWRSPQRGAVVSNLWLAGLQCPACPRAPCHQGAPTRPRSRPCACGLGGLRDRGRGRGGCSGLGGLGMPWGASRSAVQLTPRPPSPLKSEAPCRRSCRASGHGGWDWLSLAPPFARGLGLRRWRVPLAVAPVAEGGAQGPGQPDIGLCVHDAEHRPPFHKGRPLRPPVRPSRSNHGPEDRFVVLWGREPPRG